MTKPKSSRQADVNSKLEYVKMRYNELTKELLSAKRESRDPAHLVHVASDILATARECFDYLGQDIVDSHILPFTIKSKIKSDHSSGKLRAYFPFHDNQIKKPNALFHELQHTSKALYADLVNFTESISNSGTIQNTLFEYGLFLELKDMVNEKKHDKLVALVSEAGQECLIDNESFTMIIPQNSWAGFKWVAASPGSRVYRVAEYKFEYNDREVGEFCLFAHKATEMVIQGIYADHFQ